MVYFFVFGLMSGKKKRAASPSGSKLQPTVLHDTLGAYITVTCGSLSGNLYLSKLDESNKSQSKCVVVSGKIMVFTTRV